MSDKEMVLELVQKLPEDTTLEQIYRELSFVAGLREAEQQADLGQLIDHERIREELRTWTSS
jgi:predicted transcriptional regulator